MPTSSARRDGYSRRFRPSARSHLIESIRQRSALRAGDTIIREGEAADSLYLLAAGRVSICLSMKNGARRQRLSTISPGLAFGELALLDGGTRSADVIADEPALCYVLPIAKLQELAKRHPKIESKLIFNIARELSASSAPRRRRDPLAGGLSADGVLDNGVPN